MAWEWKKANEKDLAKFVNEKATDKLLIEKDPLELVQNASGREELVKAIYEALVSKNIRYNFEKYNPDVKTQLIRTPVEILSKPCQGTCLDLALLFCSLCFGYGLLPLLILVGDHALAAVSLKHKRDEWDSLEDERTMFDTDKSELFQGEANLAKLQKLVEDRAYIAVECTGFAHTQSFFDNSELPEAKGRTLERVLPFDRAVEAGKEQLNNPNRQFQFAIDIAVARLSWGIEPEPPEMPPNFPNVGFRWFVGIGMTIVILLLGIPPLIEQFNKIQHKKELYTSLKKSLDKKEWEQANEDTRLLMLHIAERTEINWIEKNAINKFPCGDLKRINRLWETYSDKTFGFNAQKRIYLEVGRERGIDLVEDNRIKFDQKAFDEFGNRVGWRDGKDWKTWDQLIRFQDFSLTEAQEGNLPRISAWIPIARTKELKNLPDERIAFFSRLQSCQK